MVAVCAPESRLEFFSEEAALRARRDWQLHIHTKACPPSFSFSNSKHSKKAETWYGPLLLLFQQRWKRLRRPNFKGIQKDKEGLQKYKKGKYKEAIGFGPIDAFENPKGQEGRAWLIYVVLLSFTITRLLKELFEKSKTKKKQKAAAGNSTSTQRKRPRQSLHMFVLLLLLLHSVLLRDLQSQSWFT
jgi:hypothetical protein